MPDPIHPESPPRRAVAAEAHTPLAMDSLAELKVAAPDPRAQLDKLSHHILSAYWNYGALNLSAFQKDAVQALRIAREIPDQSSELVGETYLLAAMVCIHRERQRDSCRPVCEKALEFIRLAHEVYSRGNWVEKTVEERCLILQHQATHSHWSDYARSSHEELGYVHWLLELKTGNPFASSQIAALAYDQARMRLLDSMPTISLPLMKRALEFAQNNSDIEKTLLMQIMGTYGYALGKSYESSDGSISPAQRDFAISEGIGFLERASQLGARILGNSLAEGYINARLLVLNLISENRSEMQFDDAMASFNRVMVEASGKIDAALVGIWTDRAKDYLEIKHPYTRQDLDQPEAFVLRQRFFNELIPIYLRALELLERLPAHEVSDEFVTELREKTGYMMIDLDRFQEALEVLEPVVPKELMLLNDQQRSIAFMQFKALVQTAQYDLAKTVAHRIIADVTLRDPMNVHCSENTAVYLRLAGEMTDADPKWSCHLIGQVIENFPRLESAYLQSALRVTARLCHIVGRKEQAIQWLALLDSSEGFAPEDSEHDGETEEQALPISFSTDEEAENEMQVSFRLSELIIRTSIYLSYEAPPMDMVEGLLEIIRSGRNDGGFVQAQFPPFISECFALDGKLSLLSQEPNEALEFFRKAQQFLSPEKPVDRFFIACNHGGAGIALARQGLLLESNLALLEAEAIFEKLVSPNIFYIQTMMQLAANYQLLGDPTNETKCLQRLATLVREVESFKVLEPPTNTVSAHATDDLF